MSACRQAISMLQARLQSSVSQSMACVDLTYDLWIRKTDGETGGEVSKLQRFLVGAGVYPEAKITGYYGDLTAQAVVRWQKAHGMDFVTTASGVGPMTRERMKCVGNTIGISGTIDSQVSVVKKPTITGTAQGVSEVGIVITSKGAEYYKTDVVIPVREVLGKGTLTEQAGFFIGNMAFAGTPTLGRAPLLVGFGGSIPLGSFIIEYGDGATETSKCTDRVQCPDPVYMVEHTYDRPGTYTARFLDGNKQVLSTVPISVLSSNASVQKVNWSITSAYPAMSDLDDNRKYEQVISIDVTFSDGSTKRYGVGNAHGCTGSSVESTEDSKKIHGKVSCYYALTGVGFTAYSENGKFIVERGDESARDGSVNKTVVLEI